MQSLYQREITGHSDQELLAQFRERPDYQRIDKAYFDDALVAICRDSRSLMECIGELADRPLAQLDPVETGILLLGFHELRDKPDVPYKVVINEAVNLAKRYGAEDGHKYVNALLDRAVGKLRTAEVRGEH